MQECKFCSASIKEGDTFCKSCGYNPKTDSVHPDFISPSQDSRPLASKRKQSVAVSRPAVGPGVKKFVLIGMAIFVFSIFYKNYFSISNVIAEVKHTFMMISKGKFKIWEKEPTSKKIEYIDVRTFED